MKRSGATRLLVLGWVLIGLVALAPPVAAHPLGAPQSVRIDGEGRAVTVRWSAAPDDLTALGLHVGALGAARTFVYERGVLVPEESDPGDAAVLAASAQLPAYLVEHIRVRQAGSACAGSVTSTEDLVPDGALLTFDCPREVDRVQLMVTMLTDLHPAYRTAATSSKGQRAMYTKDVTRHEWQLGASGDAGSLPVSAGVLGASGAIAGTVGLAGLAFLAAKRRRHEQRPVSR